MSQLKNIQEISQKKLKDVKPIIDSDGVLRVEGRMKNANVRHGKNHQIILPHNRTDCKERTLKGTYGNRICAGKHQKEILDINGKLMVKQVSTRCFHCKWANTKIIIIQLWVIYGLSAKLNIYFHHSVTLVWIYEDKMRGILSRKTDTERVAHLVSRLKESAAQKLH